MELNPFLSMDSTSAAIPGTTRRRALCAAMLQPVFRLVESRLEQQVRVSEMSQVLGLSPFHFSREFRRVTGLSPYAYVVKRRIARGGLLLAGTRMPIEEVARTIGFKTHAHFTHAFAKIAGTTPRQYRLRYGVHSSRPPVEVRVPIRAAAQPARQTLATGD